MTPPAPGMAARAVATPPATSPRVATGTDATRARVTFGRRGRVILAMRIPPTPDRESGGFASGSPSGRGRPWCLTDLRFALGRFSGPGMTVAVDSPAVINRRRLSPGCRRPWRGKPLDAVIPAPDG